MQLIKFRSLLSRVITARTLPNISTRPSRSSVWSLLDGRRSEVALRRPSFNSILLDAFTAPSQMVACLR